MSTRNSYNLFLKLTRKIRPLITSTIGTICTAHPLSIYAEPINYFTFAIWGSQKFQEFDSVQKEINTKCRTLEKDILDILQLQTVSPEQQYAIQFLIRELVLARLGYSAEIMKNYISCKKNGTPNHPESVLLSETIGCA